MSYIRQEALLNEYKGNIFEYLVGLDIARSLGFELEFLESITSDFQTMLTQQEQFVREYYPNLLKSLPKLATGLKDEITKLIDFSGVYKVQIMGKAALAANDKRFDEADILLHGQNNIYPISIKLCKTKSFVNTKSGGLRSFFLKYFSSPVAQKNFDKKINHIIDKMTFDLHSEADMDMDVNFSNWLAADYPSLPGQLEGRFREIYLNSLYAMTNALYTEISKIYKEEKSKFVNSLMPLLGFGSNQIVQATTFYRNTNNEYVLTQNLVEDFMCITKDKKSVVLKEFKKGKTSFDIDFPDRTLQLRVKAMNKFTSKSYKINCSVKKKLNSFFMKT